MLAREGAPQKSVHEYVRTGRSCGAVSVNLSCFWAYSAAITPLANERRHLISQYETPLSPWNREQGQRPLQNLQMEPLSFPSRHHMLRQQELSKCHPLDTQMQQNDKNKEEDAPICEHLRPFKNLENNKRLLGARSWVGGGGVCTPCPSLLLMSSEAPMLLLPDQTNAAGFISKHIKSCLYGTEQ